MKYLILLFFFFNNAYALVGHKDLAAIKTGSMIEVNPANYGLSIGQVAQGLSSYEKPNRFCAKLYKVPGPKINGRDDADLICTGDTLIYSSKIVRLGVFVIVKDMYMTRFGGFAKFQVINSKLNGYPPGHTFPVQINTSKREESGTTFNDVKNIGQLSQRILQACQQKGSPACKIVNSNFLP